MKGLEVLMKKIIKIAAALGVLVIFAALFVSCGSKAASYEDGIYFAQQTEFPKSGWKYNVTLKVEDGKIAEVVWNGSNINAGPDKVSVSEAGNYPMVQNGGAQADWHVQAKAVEEYFKDNPSTEMPDSITGATIHYNEFYELAAEALEKGPVGYGPYKDGTYSASDGKFHNGWKYFVDLTVTSGYVVSAYWDAVAEDGGTNKVQRSMDGEYGMVANSNAASEWHEQAQAVEKAFLESQKTAAPDAVTGATITYGNFYSLAEKALTGAKR